MFDAFSLGFNLPGPFFKLLDERVAIAVKLFLKIPYPLLQRGFTVE